MKNLKTNTRTKYKLIKNIIFDVIIVIIFIAFLLMGEELLKDVIHDRLIMNKLKNITTIFEFNKSTFALLLSTFSSITGVFLGLYFSSIGILSVQHMLDCLKN
jgi:hypothetical protein